MNETRRNPRVIIVGAGMTGILMAIRMREAGITDVVILEKKDRIGGTWRENTYPGIACDVPAHYYTYRFQPNPNWSHFFAPGDEIQRYFEGVVADHGLRDIVRLNETVNSATYKDGKWTVKTSRRKTYIADFFIAATGILHHPAIPDIKGLGSFGGDLFHTAEWNHDVQFGPGVRVGVIGNGSTAAQCVPELVNRGADVSVFMRTPQWIAYMPDFRYPRWLIALFRKSRALVGLQRWLGRRMMIFFNASTAGVMPYKLMVEWICKLSLRFGVKDRELRERLRPDYRVGCKRVVINGTFYDALQKSNAHIVQEGIDRVTKRGVVTQDGQLHELDVLVCSTGFHPFYFMRPMNLKGRGGLHIDTAWKDRIDVYNSVLCPGFPNMFLMLGPYTPVSNFSVIAMAECQADYIMQLVELWRENRFDTLEPKREAVERFRAKVRKGLEGSAWASGCSSWYLSDSGEPQVWPFTWRKYEKELARPVLDDLLLERLEPGKPKLTKKKPGQKAGTKTKSAAKKKTLARA